MPWKCSQCGVTSASDKRICEACGYIEFGTLTLAEQETAKEIKFNLDTVVGRNLLGGLGSDEVRFCSEPQFKLTRDTALGGWAIQHDPSAANPTCYNGAALGAAPQLLDDGGTISIGPVKMKLIVHLSK